MRAFCVARLVVVWTLMLEGGVLVSAQSPSSFVSSSLFTTSSTRPSASQSLDPQIQSTSTTNQTVAPTITAGLPSCAPQCLILKQAQVQCLDGNASAHTNQITYQQCFCKSPAYISLQNYDTLCSTECRSQSDRSTIRAFYYNFCSTSNSSTAAIVSATDTPATATDSATKPGATPLSKATTIGIGVAASLGLILLCCLAYYPVLRAGRRTMRSEISDHRRGSSSHTANTHWTIGKEEGGAPVAEIARSPMRRSRGSSFGEMERGRAQRSRRSSIVGTPASLRRPPDIYQVISVAAFKE